MKNTELKVVVSATDNASKKIAAVGKSVEGMTTNIGSSMKKVGRAITMTTTAVGGLAFAIGRNLLNEYAKQEWAERRLARGLKNVKDARDNDIRALVQQASALQKVTRFADDQIISAQGILSTYQLNQEAIKTLTPLLIDMAEGIATATGEMPQLEEMAHRVAKAIGGEDIAGLAGSLRRSGILLTKHQMEILKTGTKQEKLRVVVEALKDNFEGMGEAAGKTTVGKIARLNNAIGDLKEVVGKSLSGALSPFIEKLTRFAEDPRVQKRFEKIGEAIKNNIDKLIEFTKIIAIAGPTIWLGGIAIEKVGAAIHFLGEALIFLKTPMGLAVATILLLASVIGVALYKSLGKGKEGTEKLAKAMGWFKDNVVVPLKRAFEIFAETLETYIMPVVDGVLSELARSFKGLIKEIDRMLEGIGGAKIVIKGFALVIGGLVIAIVGLITIIIKLVEWFFRLGNYVKNTQAKIREWLNSLSTAQKIALAFAANPILGFFVSLWQAIKKSVEWLGKLINKLALVKMEGSVFFDITKIIGRSASGLLPGTRKQTGASYIGESGMYYLHKGEAVVPAHRTQRIGGTFVVNINGGYYLDRRVAEEMGDLIIEKLAKNVKLSAIIT